MAAAQSTAIELEGAVECRLAGLDTSNSQVRLAEASTSCAIHELPPVSQRSDEAIEDRRTPVSRVARSHHTWRRA
jgi:hypothetical protein